MGGKYSARDVRAFHTTLTVRCGETELVNSRFSAGNRSPQMLYQIFFTDRNASRKEITNEKFIDRHFSSMN
jgi:hypothetical protein